MSTMTFLQLSSLASRDSSLLSADLSPREFPLLDNIPRSSEYKNMMIKYDKFSRELNVTR